MALIKDLYGQVKRSAQVAIPVGLAALSAAGCGEYQERIVERNSPSANGYDVIIEYVGDKVTYIRIGELKEDESAGFEYNIFATDINGDKRVDEINLLDTPNLNSLESLASVLEINRIWAEVEGRHVGEGGNQ